MEMQQWKIQISSHVRDWNYSDCIAKIFVHTVEYEASGKVAWPMSTVEPYTRPSLNLNVIAQSKTSELPLARVQVTMWF